VLRPSEHEERPDPNGKYENDGVLYNYRNRYYHPKFGRFISGDPLGLDAGQNFYAYVNGNPIRYTDPLGLDTWIEGPSGSEPSLHQSVNVGDPNGAYSSYSFGMNGNGMQGEVYRDTSLGGGIEDYKKMTPAEDAAMKKILDGKLGEKGTYGSDDICRSWSQRQFQNAPGIPAASPTRTGVPQDPGAVSPTSSQMTTNGASSSGTGTSR